ncbi:MAG: response regulator [Deltaproteobacteria bacterium]|nr:response regulator [Deltaproteobacteria bacterium]MCW5802366.1 response regulator [Deltaproteobacteria bacterium]
MSRSILIVDDEYGLADMLSMLLETRGFECTVAIDGALGLAQLEKKRFSLVLTDVMMPRMDGLEMVRRMRALDHLADVPVIVMTAVPSGVSPHERALVQGVLAKPFGQAELARAIELVLA